MKRPEQTLIVQADRLIDGAGRPPLDHPTVVIRAGRIAAILTGEPADLPADAERIRLPGATLVPGLIDCHLHLMGDQQIPPSEWARPPLAELERKAARHAGEALRAGVTTVRDCGAVGDLVLDLRTAIDAGRTAGPHVWACGNVITTPAGHGHFMGLEARGAAQVARAVEALIERGADFIKVIASGGGGTPGTYPWDSQFSVEELRAAVETAHRRGRRVCAHAHSVAAIRNCLDAGVDTLEHATFITAEGPRFQPDLARRLASAGAWVIPTIACYRNPITAGLSKTFIKKIGMQGMDFVELHQRQVRQMLDAGVRVAGGTDGVQVGVGPADIADEALYLGEVAGSALFGLRAVTALAAQALGLEADRGTLEPGQRADMLAVRGDPLQDLRALRRVERVFKDGQIIGETK